MTTTFMVVLMHLIRTVHLGTPIYWNQGVFGWVEWIQPKHLISEVGVVHGHLISNYYRK